MIYVLGYLAIGVILLILNFAQENGQIDLGDIIVCISFSWLWPLLLYTEELNVVIWRKK